MKRADPDIYLYCALMLYMLGMPSIGAVCILLHIARCPVPRGPRHGIKLREPKVPTRRRKLR